MMKKKIVFTLIKILGALFTAWLLVRILDGVFTPKYVSENQDGNVTSEFYEVETPLDAVYFGSSTVYNAITADYLWKEYGFTSYTRANASQTLWQSYYMIRDTVRNNRPELITLDVSFMKYGEDFTEEPSNRKAIDGMRFSVDKIRCAKASMWEDEDIYSYVFPILRYHSRWKELKEEDYKYAMKKPQVTYDGFIMSFERPEKVPEFDPMEPESYDFPEKAEEYLLKIMDYCRDEDIDLLLMKTPTYINNWFPEYDARLEKLSEGYENCDYINFDSYEKEMELDRAVDYADGHSHMNVDGAEKFSKYFGAYIKERYELPDHRGDDRYSSIWNDRYTRYSMDLEKGKAALQ